MSDKLGGLMDGWAGGVPESYQLLGVDLQLSRSGEGPPILFLHGEDGLLFSRALISQLARNFTVLAPSHPGWRGKCPRHIRSLDDLAYIYLELLDRLGVSCGVVGCSIGGWLAAEMATKSESRLSSLVLVAPLGIKTTGRRERTFMDIFATRPTDLSAALYADESSIPDLTGFEDDQFLALAEAQEAVARFGWEPYLHNPQLPHRLARISRPTLIVSGAADHFVLDPEYYEKFCGLIGGAARHVILDRVGHRAEEEAPERLSELVAEFCGSVAGRAAEEAGRV